MVTPFPMIQQGYPQQPSTGMQPVVSQQTAFQPAVLQAVNPQTQQPGGAPPKTSGALVFQIFNPVNYAEGGAASAAAPTAAPSAQPVDSFQRAATAPQTPNPNAPMQQQLQDAYNHAINAKNNYVNLYRQFNNLGSQFAQQWFGAPQGQPYNPQQAAGGYQTPPPLQQAYPQGSYPQQQQGYYQQQGMSPQQAYQQQYQQQMAQAQQQAYQQQYMQQYQQQLAQQQQQAYQQQYQQQMAQQQAYQQQAYQQQMAQYQAAQQQAYQQQMAAQQQAYQQQMAQQQQPPQPQMAGLSAEQLNQIITQPPTLEAKRDAMQEVAYRGQAPAETFELLKQEALQDTSTLPPGTAQDDANYIRQCALWALATLNKSQNANIPTKELPGLTAIRQVLGNKNESPVVKEAAVQALWVLDRNKDKEITNLLKQAAKDSSPDVQKLAKEALSGTTFAEYQARAGAPADAQQAAG